MRAAALGAVTATALAGCHVTTYSVDAEEVSRELVPHKERAEATAYKTTVTKNGRIRFANHTVCPHDVMVTEKTYEVAVREPNIATLVIGIIVVAAGGIATAVGLSDDEPGSSPATYLGLVGVAGGAPFVVGPFLRNTTTRKYQTTRTVPKGAAYEPCGDRGLPAGLATIDVNEGQRIIARTDAEGRLSVPVFEIIDAYQAQRMRGLDLQIKLVADNGQEHEFRSFLQPQELLDARNGFLTANELDLDFPPLRKISDLRADNLMIVPGIDDDGRPIVDVSFSVINFGPGEAFGVRGQLMAGDPRLNERYVYIGRVVKGEAKRGTVRIYLGDAPFEVKAARISLLLRDAHNTAPDVRIHPDPL